MKNPMVSIITLNVNEKDFILQCLKSLSNINFPYGYEVIVVDNGSTDGSPELIKKNFPDVRLIQNKENLGFTGGNNIGAKVAKGKYLLLLNNDTKVSKNFLLELFKVAESDDKIGICAPKQLVGDKNMILYGGGAINYTGLSYSINMYKRDFKDERIRETAFASGAAFFIRKSIVDKIGLFDDDYFIYHEDVDVSWRVRLAGYKIVYVPKSVIRHYFKFKRRPSKMYLLERNRYMTLLKNYSTRSLVLVTPILLLMEIPLFLYSIMRGWLTFKLKSYYYVLRNMGNILKKRCAVQRMRKTSDKELIKFFTPEISYAQESYEISLIASYLLMSYWLLIRKLF
jgi:GT2 family glycosyltransferase